MESLAQVSEISKVVSPDTFERPIYAGNAVQTVQATDAKKVITVRTSTFVATGEGGAAAIEAVSGGWPKILSNLKSLLETGQIVLAPKA